jgi:probable HAF family extracellular repeat protein
MRSTKLARIFTTLVMLFALGNLLSAQDTSLVNRRKHPKYKLIDLGTLGGPVSYEPDNGEGNQVLNNSGVIASSADTSVPDPNAPDFCFNPDCFLAHAVRWDKGVLTDLGTLPGNNSKASAINARGWIVGISPTDVIDPVIGGPENHAVLWKDDQITDLGTMGGTESVAVYVNNSGQVVGMATINTDPDPFSFFGAPIHPFIWEDGKKVDIGTLGGPDAFVSAGCVNEREGFVAGASFTNAIPNTITGLPTLDPFVWKKGTMIDLGTLGGTLGSAQCANDRGQVIGQSDLTGDFAFHPFIWQHGILTDLGTLGGDNGTAVWINNAGEVVGEADLPGSLVHHAFLWRNGVMKDLGTLGDDSHASAINSKGQVVGNFFISGRTEPPFRHAFLWEEGGPMVDLNTLIPADSGLELVAADNINERGEIVGVGVPDRCSPDFCGHFFLLVPCGAGDTHGCEDKGESLNAAVQGDLEAITISSTSAQARPTPKERAAAWRAQMAKRYHIRGLGAQRN